MITDARNGALLQQLLLMQRMLQAEAAMQCSRSESGR
jgi:hypothetical protein